jgi:sulfoxide reductase catalytic subunit YedY
MHIGRQRSWDLPDSAVTPESDYLRRREFLRVFGLARQRAFFPSAVRAATAGFRTLSIRFSSRGVKLTPYDLVTSYNNFYEWGSRKRIPRVFQPRLEDRTGTEIGGLCDQPGKYDVNDLIKIMGGIEQRNYRHRCARTWSMVVPGRIPSGETRRLLSTTDSRTCVQFTTFSIPPFVPDNVRGISVALYRGADNRRSEQRLAFLATGIYGKPLLNQNGAPIRLVVPWKYGFKGAKSLVRIDFVAEQQKRFGTKWLPTSMVFTPM